MHDEDGVEQLYLVCEARGMFNFDDLDWDKAMRTRFAWRHLVVARAGKVDNYFTAASAGLRIEGEWADRS